MLSKLKIKSNKSRGFTLLELIAVMVISTIIMTAFIVVQGRWNDQIAVSAQGYEMALYMRQAQVYSLGVREYSDGVGDKFSIGYGVYFNIAEPDRYYFFVDKNRDLEMNAGETLETIVFNRGVSVKSLCGENNSGAQRCYPQNGINQIAVTFYRPNPNAVVKFFNSAGSVNTSVGSPATIYLESLGGQQATLVVDSNGQISTTE